jgi:SH3-like domain-containing protein
MKAYLKHNVFTLCTASLLLFCIKAEAHKTNTDFIYLKANEVNLRSGPDAKHPIKWVVRHRGEPMQVIETFYHWLHVRNIDGYEGWMQSPMASKKQVHGVVISKDNTPVLGYAMSSIQARKVMRLAPKARVRVMKCNSAGWCKIKAKELVAWIEKKNLWGI